MLLGEDGAPFLDPFAPKAYTVTGKSWVNNHVHVLSPFADTIPISYLRYYLDIFDYRDYVTGTTRLKLNQARMSSIPIPLAPKNEQHRIVDAIESYFTRLDAAEAALRRAQAKLAQYKTALLKAACEGRLVPTEVELARQEGRSYEPADRLLARILKERRAKWEAEEWARLVERAKQRAAAETGKAAAQEHGEALATGWLDLPEAAYAKYLPKGDTWKDKYQEPVAPDVEGLPELPDGWCWATMDALTECVSGVAKGRNLKERLTEVVPYLRVANVQQGQLDLTDIKKIVATSAEIEQYRLMSGDLLMTEGGDRDKLGRAAIWREQIPVCIHQNHIFRARPYLSNLRSDWLMYVANSEHGRNYFMSKAKQTTNLASINLTQLRSFPVPVPPLAEMTRLIDELQLRFSVIEEVGNELTATLMKSSQFRKAILRDAYSGKLVTQDLSEEPARLLLERIGEERRIRAEAEIAERKKRTEPNASKEEKVSKKEERRSLLDVLMASESMLSPEELFDRAGYTVELVDEFYEELRNLIPEQVREQRSGTASIGLIVAKHANQTA